jgi:hypothetical protein
MCGRYRIKDTDALTEELRRVFKIPDWVMGPCYNVAPSQELPVIVSNDVGNARVATMRWGLVPFWDKSEKPKIAPINARAEEAFTKPMFRQSIQKRRALIPSRKAVDKQRDWFRENINASHSFEPMPDLIDRVNGHLRGWRNYFSLGHPQREYRKLNFQLMYRLSHHLHRRSQRSYHVPENLSLYEHLKNLGLVTL